MVGIGVSGIAKQVGGGPRSKKRVERTGTADPIRTTADTRVEGRASGMFRPSAGQGSSEVLVPGPPRDKIRSIEPSRFGLANGAFNVGRRLKYGTAAEPWKGRIPLTGAATRDSSTDRVSHAHQASASTPYPEWAPLRTHCSSDMPAGSFARASSCRSPAAAPSRFRTPLPARAPLHWAGLGERDGWERVFPSGDQTKPGGRCAAGGVANY